MKCDASEAIIKIFFILNPTMKRINTFIKEKTMPNFKKTIKFLLSVCLAAFLILPLNSTDSVKAIEFLDPNITFPSIDTLPPIVTPPESEYTQPDPDISTEEEPPIISETEPPISETEPPISETDIETGEEPTEPPVVLAPEMQLSFYSASLEVGQGAQLTASVVNSPDPAPQIAFYSSNTAVARIDASGYIIAIGAGTTEITAYWSDVMATAVVTVTEPAAVPEYIVISKTEFQLKIGAVAQIEAKLLPEEIAEDYTMTYTADNTDAVSVDENGLITALNTGEANITVESAGISETVHVVVSNDIAYDYSKLDGYLYDTSGKPVSGERIVIDDLSAVTDSKGYFSFDEAEQRELTIKLSSDPDASCAVVLTGDLTVYLLYEKGSLTQRSSYDELAGLLPVNTAIFDSRFKNIVLTVGQVESLTYQYEPKDAVITEILYSSSNTHVAQIGQIDGVITAKSPGEAVITLSLNGGQAEAVCTVTVNPTESTQYSILIMSVELAFFVVAAIIVIIAYKKYKKKAENIDEDEDGESDIHDID